MSSTMEMEMEWWYDQPSGMKFEPTEEQLLEFLLHKVNGLQPISLSRDLDQVIPTEDLYGQKEPWEIFGDSWEKKLFFFTKLKKVGNKKKTCHRFLRNVGKGTWTNKGQKKIVFREPGKVMGYRRCYRYERKKNDDDAADDHQHGIWLLQEFILPEVAMKNDNVKQEFKDYALCILKKKMTKKEKERMMRSRYAKKTAPLPLSVIDDDDSGCWDFLDNDEIDMLPTPTECEGGGGEEMCAKTPPLPSDDGGCCWDLIDIDELLELPLPPIPDEIQENNNNNNQFEERCADDLMMDLFNFDAFPVVSAF